MTPSKARARVRATARSGKVALAALPLLVALPLLAALPIPAAPQALDLPEPRGWVNDFAEVLSAETERRLEDVIGEVRDKSGGEIVVVTLTSLQGRSRDEVALELGRRWGVGARGEAGDPGRNLGAVVLVVPKETSPDGQGHVKIELGDNTSRFVSAGDAGRIRDRYMIPAFRRQDYDTGVLAGTVALAGMYAEALGFELTGEAAEALPQGDGGGPPIGTLVLFVFLFLAAARVVSRALRGPRGPRGPGGGGGRRGRGGSIVILPGMGGWGGRRGGGGGGFGGGFGGFGGGGGFSGGGAGGSW